MIAAIELAMLERLRVVAAAGVLPLPTWKLLATYPDNWEEYLASTVAITCPAAYVVFAGLDPSAEVEQDGDWSDGRVIVSGNFAVMVVDENLRSDEQYRRHGGPDLAKEPGSYNLLTAAIVSLVGQDLDMLSTPLKLSAVRPVVPTVEAKKRNLNRWSALLTCTFPLMLVGNPEDPVELLDLHANWDIPDFGRPVPVDAAPGTPGVQLPDDFHADATDTVALREQP